MSVISNIKARPVVHARPISAEAQRLFAAEASIAAASQDLVRAREAVDGDYRRKLMQAEHLLQQLRIAMLDEAHG